MSPKLWAAAAAVVIPILAPELFRDQIESLRQAQYLWCIQFVCIAWGVAAVSTKLPAKFRFEWTSGYHVALLFVMFVWVGSGTSRRPSGPQTNGDLRLGLLGAQHPDVRQFTRSPASILSQATSGYVTEPLVDRAAKPADDARPLVGPAPIQPPEQSPTQVAPIGADAIALTGSGRSWLKTLQDGIDEGRALAISLPQVPLDGRPMALAEAERFVFRVRNTIRASLGADYVLCFNKATNRKNGDFEEYIRAVAATVDEVVTRIIPAVQQRYRDGSVGPRITASCP